MALDKKDQLSGPEAVDKLRDLLAHFPIAFMVTVDAMSTHARPIGVVGDTKAFDGTLWFITDRRSQKVAQISDGAETTLVFQNDERGTYAHMRGTATIVENREKLAELYTPDQRTWFPEGLDDPHMTLVRFDVSDADYWDGHNSAVRRTVAFITAVVTGRAGREGHTGVAKLT
jgi:general stress protein 26